ncbi:glycosyl transferase family 1 [Sulfuriferula sp. AH1]|uniref:glycosyltransferase n=1 Tax=Sulfuriferula sp. AH1 TaxID=1985873 RepID=UPI000B3B26FD|nr:glycosyltransferase [Sulfuriferula sp. AH1]ARU30413.1 glycosyl transferase family 1 [Sulfuriferula sp. AH1]
MNILMISDVYFPRVNGVSTSIMTLRRELKALGHTVTLVAPAYDMGEAPEDDIVRINGRPVLMDPEDRLMSLKSLKALPQMLSAQSFDLVHIHTPFLAHYTGLSLAKAFNIPCVETYHTFFEEYLYHYIPFLPKALMRYAARHFSRRQCAQVDGLVLPSIAMDEALKRYGVRAFSKIIPTGIELSDFSHCDPDGFRRTHGIAPERPVVVYVGRVAFEKNIEFLLLMLSQLRHSIPDVLLIIAGEGPAEAKLRKTVEGLNLAANVLFVGYLERATELPACYCAGNAFVFASRTETQGLVLLEAMALGVPVVSTAVMGTRDILTAGRGCRVAEDNPVAFAATLQEVLTDSTLRARLSIEARQHALDWSAPQMAQQMLAFYQLAQQQFMRSAQLAEV